MNPQTLVVRVQQPLGNPAAQLQVALQGFEAVLTPSQRLQLRNSHPVPDAAAVTAFTQTLDAENANQQRRCVATRLHPLLESVQKFTTIVDTFVSSHPDIAALVWGSLKLALVVS